MSLKTALKVGLGTLDESNPRRRSGAVTETSKSIISKPSLMNKNKVFNEQKAKQSNLTESLSDSLPIPKLISSPGQHAANLNKKTRVESQVNVDFKKVKVSEREQVGKQNLCEGNVNPRQYVVELDRFLSRQNSNLTQGIVLDVSSKEIEQIIKSLPPDTLKDNAVQAAISSYDLLKNNEVKNSKSEILKKIKENATDLDTKMDYSKVLLNESNFSECIDVLLEIFKQDKEWKEGLAKKQLLLIFDHLGSDDELSKKGRRALTSLIFV